MLCSFPLIFLIVTTAQETSKMPVPAEALKPAIIVELEDGHEECRRRKIGECLLEVHLKPKTRNKKYLCGKSRHKQVSK
jgi:hypothetical protein